MAESIMSFMEREMPEEPYLIGRGILPKQAKMIIGGGPKIGKSYLVLNMAMDLALGRDLFGAKNPDGTPVFPVSQACRVLYIEMEIGDVGLQERFKGKDGKPGLLTGASPELMDFLIKTRDTALRLDTEKGCDLLYDEVKAVRPDVVILDPMAKFHLLDENSAQDMSIVGRVSDHMIEDTGCSVAWVHHAGKPPSSAFESPRQGGDRLRGSSAIFADVDTVVLVDTLDPDGKQPEPVLALDFILRRGTPIGEVLVRRTVDGRIVYDPKLTRKDAERSRKGRVQYDRY